MMTLVHCITRTWLTFSGVDRYAGDDVVVDVGRGTRQLVDSLNATTELGHEPGDLFFEI